MEKIFEIVIVGNRLPMIDLNEKIRFVELKEYNPEWLHIYADAANEIKSILKENCIQIHHMGSTAIPNINASSISTAFPGVNGLVNTASIPASRQRRLFSIST